MKEVDSFRFTGKMIKKFVLNMIENEQEQKFIPWAPKSKDISSSRISLVTTAGISMKTDKHMYIFTISIYFYRKQLRKLWHLLTFLIFSIPEPTHY